MRRPAKAASPKTICLIQTDPLRQRPCRAYSQRLMQPNEIVVSPTNLTAWLKSLGRWGGWSLTRPFQFSFRRIAETPHGGTQISPPLLFHYPRLGFGFGAKRNGYERQGLAVRNFNLAGQVFLGNNAIGLGHPANMAPIPVRFHGRGGCLIQTDRRCPDSEPRPNLAEIVC